ncbi:DEAD/DEAH box helicase family protein [Microcoleus sp. herbarium14]|uniref:DEAD/DEAH box helicase family protein n=1 Tax=Microcoleus sp. herbarium14 TaxID=3055439 RepID=UPI002FCFEBB5
MTLNKASWMNSETWTKFIAKWGRNPQCNWDQGCNEVADTVDHIHARRNGGTDDITNLQPLCRKHNSQKGIKPDAYWEKIFFFDHPRINLGKLRTAQRREGWDRIDLDYQDWFLRPWNQINRTIYGNFWIVGAGKTLAPVVQACALNYIIQKNLGKSHPRINRILILTKEVAIRDQIANSLRSKEDEGENELVKYGISSTAPRVGVISEGWQLTDSTSLERCDIWVSCIHQFFETNHNPKDNLSMILAQFPFIAIDEPHHALDQVLNIVQKAVDSLVFGYTGTPVEEDGKALSQFTLLSVYDYDDANENDHSMKYVSDKEEEFTYFVDEVGITNAELINDAGFEITEDATQEGYNKNLIPQLSVVQEVITYMESCDKIEGRQESVSDLAPHRPEGTKAELWYPVHSMIVVDSVAVGQKICEQINQIFERNRKRFPKEKGYQAEIIHSNISQALEDKNLNKDEKEYVKKSLKGKKMSPNHPWMLYQQTPIWPNEHCKRVLVVIGMAREGVSNRYCGCIGYACSFESLIELVQRAIGRQIRSYDNLKKHLKPGETDLDVKCQTLLTPPKRLDSVKIITHVTYGNAHAIRRAISYICNMRDKLDSIPTLEELMQGSVTPGVDIPVQGILTAKEKIDIAGNIGQSKLSNPEKPINTGEYQDRWGENNQTKKTKISEWVQKVVDNPEEAEREINYTGMLPEIPVVWDEKLDSKPTKDKLIQYIKTHHPNFITYLQDPQYEPLLIGLYQQWAESFDMGNIPTISKLSDIRNSIVYKVKASLGAYLRLDESLSISKRDKIVYQLVGTAMRWVLGTKESLTDNSRYNCPQAQAILTRKDVIQKILGWVRNQLIAKGYCPDLAAAFEINIEDS